jgi:hypothetical protein
MSRWYDSRRVPSYRWAVAWLNHWAGSLATRRARGYCGLGKDDVRGVGPECAGWIGVLHDDDLPTNTSLNVVVERGNKGLIERCGLVGSRRCLRIGWSIRDEGAVEDDESGVKNIPVQAVTEQCDGECGCDNPSLR